MDTFPPAPLSPAAMSFRTEDVACPPTPSAMAWDGEGATGTEHGTAVYEGYGDCAPAASTELKGEPEVAARAEHDTSTFENVDQLLMETEAKANVPSQHVGLTQALPDSLQGRQCGVSAGTKKLGVFELSSAASSSKGEERSRCREGLDEALHCGSKRSGWADDDAPPPPAIDEVERMRKRNKAGAPYHNGGRAPQTMLVLQQIAIRTKGDCLNRLYCVLNTADGNADAALGQAHKRRWRPPYEANKLFYFACHTF